MLWFATTTPQEHGSMHEHTYMYRQKKIHGLFGAELFSLLINNTNSAYIYICMMRQTLTTRCWPNKQNKQIRHAFNSVFMCITVYVLLFWNLHVDVTYVQRHRVYIYINYHTCIYAYTLLYMFIVWDKRCAYNMPKGP